MSRSTVNHRANARKADRLAFLVRQYMRGDILPPATVKALGVAALAGLSTFAVGASVLPSPVLPGLASGFLVVISYRLVVRRTTNLTAEEHLFSLLAEYQPLDQAGYQRFQTQARESGDLDWYALEAWLKSERSAHLDRSLSAFAGARKGPRGTTNAQPARSRKTLAKIKAARLLAAKDRFISAQPTQSEES